MSRQLYVILSKAFDCIDQNDLIVKLNYCEITIISSLFLKPYLTNRRLKVLINANWSNELVVHVGVP